MTKKAEKIGDRLLRIATDLNTINKKIRFYGTDQPLYDAEIHMIKEIYSEGDASVTVLAARLGITKGAVSQTVSKLEQKGMLTREKDLENKSKRILQLTPKGYTAYMEHEKLHRQFGEMVGGLLEDTSEKRIQFLSAFLKKVDSGMRRWDAEQERKG